MRPSRKSGFVARISSRITTVIRVARTIKQTITDLMSHSQFHSISSLYLDMHGLIFETSIWLLAGSTRYSMHRQERITPQHHKRVAQLRTPLICSFQLWRDQHHSEKITSLSQCVSYKISLTNVRGDTLNQVHVIFSSRQAYLQLKYRASLITLSHPALATFHCRPSKWYKICTTITSNTTRAMAARMQQSCKNSLFTR